MQTKRSYKKESQECIYVVDVKPHNSVTILEILHLLDVKVVTFDCPNRCLRNLAKHACSLLITNITLPDMNGIDLLQEVKKCKPWVPVLLISDANDVSKAVMAMKMGASDYLERPFNRESFLNSVKTLLDQTRRYNKLLGQTLTKTECMILPLIVKGYTNQSISEKLYRSVRTIEHHRQHIFQKLEVSNVAELNLRLEEIGVNYESLLHVNKEENFE